MKTPKLKKNQYAVLMVDTMTGIVLNTEESYSIKQDDDVYILFDNLDTAKKFINKKKSIKPLIDFTIYDCDYNLIEYIDAGQQSK